MASVLFVCLGNICRSPMAEGICRHKLGLHGLEDQVEVDSAGTSGWHEGEPADPRTLEVLSSHGIRVPLFSRQLRAEDYKRFDLLLAMDHNNLAAMKTRCPTGQEHKLRMMLELTGGGEVPDPYYGGSGGFERVYQMLDDAMDAWLSQLM